MTLLLTALGIFVAFGTIALFLPRHSIWVSRVGVSGIVLGALTGLIPVFSVLGGAEAESFSCAWNVPYGSFSLGLDPLSAFFLLLVFGLGALAAIYGTGYLESHRGKKSLGAAWFFYALLVAGMALVVLARNGVLFLIAWEVMSLAAFFLVTFESEKEEVRNAGWTYLIATHLGAAFLFAFFILLLPGASVLDFGLVSALAPQRSVSTGVLFLLALIGFGSKAGFVPLHVWLPEAYPAAPSFVAGFMSGAMSKLGIYGLLRTLVLIGPPPEWCAWLLIGVGLSSGLIGILYVLVQHNLKRLLAYSSVENLGIVCTGVGVGMLGAQEGKPLLALLGYGGALLHILNHGLFKSLLFFCAGSLERGAGTCEIERLGGVLKRMPWTGATFFIGAVAISALPPLNGFFSEFLIFLGAFKGVQTVNDAQAVPFATVILGLALIGGLAAAGFTKAFGIVFCGQPRSEQAALAHETGWALRLPLCLLAAACLAAALGAPYLLKALQPVVAQVAGTGALAGEPGLLSEVCIPLTTLVIGAWAVLILIGLLFLLRYLLLSKRAVGETGTWDCGYAQPTARMQYTGASYTQPLAALFSALFQRRRDLERPEGLFPQKAHLAIQTQDSVTENVYRPAFLGTGWILLRLRWIQHGRVQIYVLYIALTLLALLLWKLG